MTWCGMLSFLPPVGEVMGRALGFVPFKERKLAIKAVKVTNGSSAIGRKLTVNIAKYGVSFS